MNIWKLFIHLLCEKCSYFGESVRLRELTGKRKFDYLPFPQKFSDGLCIFVDKTTAPNPLTREVFENGGGYPPPHPPSYTRARKQAEVSIFWLIFPFSA